MQEKGKIVKRINRFEPPAIYKKDRSEMIEQIKAMVPFYTPEWRFSEETPDPGSVLFLIVAEMLQENIKRLNRVPLKNYIAYLNLLNSRMLPAKPASAYVTFSLVDGYQHPVHIPAGTQLLAQQEDNKLIFETENNLLVTPTQLNAAYQADGITDVIYPCPLVQSLSSDAMPTTSFPIKLFDFSTGLNRQEHVWFFAHDDLFNIKGQAQIIMKIQNSNSRYAEEIICQQLADQALVEWLYATDEGWVPFDHVSALGNQIVLQKRKSARIISTEINGKTGRWVKGKIKSILHFDEQYVQLTEMHLQSNSIVDLEREGEELCADQLFQDDFELNPTGFFPFGKVFAPYSILYIASQDAFSKKRAKITLTFDLGFRQNRLHPEVEPDIEWKLLMKKSTFHRPVHPPIKVAHVAWEYWNGKAWVQLHPEEGSELIFNGNSTGEQTVTFTCPEDIEEVFVHAHLNYWIRVRVVQIDNLYSPDPVYLSPWLEGVRLAYDYQNTYLSPQACLSKNNLEYTDILSNLVKTEAVFQPFYRQEAKAQALYLGFENAPSKGPLSLFFSVQNQKYDSQTLPQISWEYLSTASGNRVWKPLKVVDDTYQFTRSGTVLFFGAEDLGRTALFGTSSYWIRAVNHNRLDPTKDSTRLPILLDFYLNAVRVVQREGTIQEVPSRLAVEGGSEYQLEGQNIVHEQIWIEETNSIQPEELAQLRQTAPDGIRILEDSAGQLQKVWVKWWPTDSFYDSLPTDRHYIVNHHAGRIRFGDGKRGKVPQITSEEQIKVIYSTVKGSLGNVEALAINSLQRSIPFIQAVFNPEPASGGCDAEQLEQAMQRIPQVLKHRRRAVTAKDFERIVQEAYPQIARVKCLANYNVYMKKEVGSMTVVVLLGQGRKDSGKFPEYKKNIEQLLLQHTANVIAYQQKIQVIEPAFLEVSVHAVLFVASLHEMVTTEWKANQLLQEYLNSITGQGQKGWGIGETIHHSAFYSLLSSIPEVAFIDSCFMTLVKVEDGERIDISVDQMVEIPHGVICNGIHSIQVKTI